MCQNSRAVSFAEFLNLELGVKLDKAPKLGCKTFGPEFWTHIPSMAGIAQFSPHCMGFL